ncbi:MAG: lipopolysaccharide biosynthesis protein, partial [Chloroflexi bacterium]|nr:lipopolysaccharide biosynthesis protein [Chloroflexota bacterium]
MFPRRIGQSGPIQWLLHPGPRLSQRAFNAAVWTFGTKFLQRTVSYIRIIALARLLSPVDFGIMGLGLVLMSAVQALNMPGFREALVQKKGEIEEYLDTLWTVTLVRSLIISGVLALGAPLLANLFGSPDARLVLQVMAAAVLITGLTNPGIIYFEKNLEFQKKTVVDVIPTVAEVITAIVAAVILRNVWALVLGLFARNISLVAVSYWCHPYRPRLSWNKQQAKELFGFGRWVYFTRVLTFIVNQADSMVLARLLWPASLGFYQMAQRTSLVPLQEIRRGVSTVAFPLYSKVQDDLVKLRRAFMGSVEAVASISIPLAVAVVVLAPDFVSVVLGEKWLPSVPAIQVLAVAGALNSLTGAGSSLFMGSGRPWLSFQMTALRVVVLLAVVFPLTIRYGIAGASYAALLATVAGFGFYVYQANSILRIPAAEAFKIIAPVFGVGAAVALVTLSARTFLGPLDLPGLLLVAFLVLVAYAGVLVVLWWQLKVGLVG